MFSRKLTGHLVTLTIVLLLCANTAAADLDYKNRCLEVNKEPWVTYQALSLIESDFESFDKSNKLEFLICKAKAENLLYFYPKFNHTVSKAESLVDAHSRIEFVASLKFFRGLIEQRLGNYKASAAAFEEAIALTKESDLVSLHIRSLQELAYTKSLTNLYVISFNKIREAFVKAKKLNDPFLLGTVYETYGAIYGFLGDYSASIEHYEKALESYQNLSYRPFEAEAIYGLASTYRYWEKYDTAIKYFNQYIEKTSYTPNSDVTFFGLYGLSMSLAEKGECEKALLPLQKALTLNGAADYDAELYKRKASCHIKMGELEKATGALNKAVSIFASLPELKNTKWELETYKIEGDIAKAKGDYQTAYKLSTKYYQQYTKLLAESSSKQLSNISSSFELASRDAKIALLQQQAKVQQLEADKHLQNSMKNRYTIAIAISIILLVLTALFFQRRHTQKIMAISIRDSLSELYNRRHIFQIFDKLIASLENHRAKLSIILLDIDDFKNINDRYGHPFGDKVIKKVSEICQSTLRSEDAMGRIGGEEFLCLLPRIDHDTCISIANRMLKNVADHQFTTDNNEQLRITISIGITSSTNRAKTRQALLIQADKALYHSKNTGKNCISSYEDL